MTDDEGNPSAWQSVRLKHPHAADEPGKSVGTDCVGGSGRGASDWWIPTHTTLSLYFSYSLFLFLLYSCGKTYKAGIVFVKMIRSCLYFSLFVSHLG